MTVNAQEKVLGISHLHYEDSAVHGHRHLTEPGLLKTSWRTGTGRFILGISGILLKSRYAEFIRQSIRALIVAGQTDAALNLAESARQILDDPLLYRALDNVRTLQA